MYIKGGLIIIGLNMPPKIDLHYFTQMILYT